MVFKTIQFSHYGVASPQINIHLFSLSSRPLFHTVLDKAARMHASETTKDTKEPHPIEDSMGSNKELVPRDASDQHVTGKKDLRFWLIIVSLSISAVLAALDATIITTTLPTITATLGGGEEYVWVTGSYFLTMLVNTANTSA